MRRWAAPTVPCAACATLAAQNALQNYWNKNRQSIPRCAAHYLSGKTNVEWVVSVGCRWQGGQRRHHCSCSSSSSHAVAPPCFAT